MVEELRGGVIEGERQKAKGKSADEEPDFGAEDRGRYRHPDTVGGLPYSVLEQRVFAALAADVRTLMRIKEHAGLERAFDLSPVIEGMELDRKIRHESNGNITAFFRWEQMPKKFWNNGDGTVGAEFVEDFVPPEPVVTFNRQGFTYRDAGPNSGPTDEEKKAIQKAKGLDLALLEFFAGRRETYIDAAEALEMDPDELDRLMCESPEVTAAWERGRVKWPAFQKQKAEARENRRASKANQVLRKPVIPAEIKTEKEITMSAAATAPAPEKAEYTPQEMEVLALEHGTPGRVAKALGCTHHTQVSNLLRNRPELKAAFDRGVAAYRIANPIDDPKPREARGERRKAKPTPPPTPASMNAGSSAEIGTTPQEDEEMELLSSKSELSSSKSEGGCGESRVPSPKSRVGDRGRDRKNRGPQGADQRETPRDHPQCSGKACEAIAPG
jgi:hypothetical protein